MCLLNYRKDGRPFWNQLCLTPVLDNLGVAYYIGIQTDVTGVVLAHRSKLLSPYSTIPGQTADSLAKSAVSGRLARLAFTELSAGHCVESLLTLRPCCSSTPP